MVHSTQAQADGGLVNVMLLGHFYVRWLRQYAARSQSTANLRLSGIQVRYVCLAGMTLRPRLRGGSRGGYTPSIRDHLQAVTVCCLSVIMLHIGENDLGYVKLVRLLEKYFNLPAACHVLWLCCVRDSFSPGLLTRQRQCWTSRR